MISQALQYVLQPHRIAVYYTGILMIVYRCKVYCIRCKDSARIVDDDLLSYFIPLTSYFMVISNLVIHRWLLIYNLTTCSLVSELVGCYSWT